MCLHCHVVSIRVEVKNFKALIAGCNRLAWTFTIGHEVHGYLTRCGWLGELQGGRTAT
jgi:hypothetical protein